MTPRFCSKQRVKDKEDINSKKESLGTRYRAYFCHIEVYMLTRSLSAVVGQPVGYFPNNC